MSLQGVNLGGWLALEKWLSPALFSGTTAEDETDLYQQLPWEEITARLDQHRKIFITEQDFRFIAQSGLSLVRLPVPYTLFGQEPGRYGCIEWVDKAFCWAEKFHLQILLDLHTVPGGQNALDNGGTIGMCKWHLHSCYVEQTLDILEQIVRRYVNSPAFFGIEPVNEPVNEALFSILKKTTDPLHQKNFEESSAVPTNFLMQFYKEAYQRLHPFLKNDQKIVFQDGFRLEVWDDFMPQEEYPNVWFDTHLYLNLAWRELNLPDAQNHIQYLYKNMAPKLQHAQKYHPILVGEWTLAHHASDLQSLSDSGLKRYYQAIGALQLTLYESSAGWCFFNYRVNSETRPAWDLCKVLHNHWLVL